jgi:hypothetical protein
MNQILFNYKKKMFTLQRVGLMIFFNFYPQKMTAG